MGESIVEQWKSKSLEGYTGSGIVNAAKRACLSRSVREDLNTKDASRHSTGQEDAKGERQPIILIKDFEEAFKNIPSSVTPHLMKKYQAFNEARFWRAKINH